jgi:hypothetical protein
MCEYAGDTKDPQRYNQTPLTDEEATIMVKSLLRETLENCRKVGVNPFCALNAAPPVSVSVELSSCFHQFL